ncbi:MAG: hypothetical protein LUG18_01445 [Candidatus Azobacteroides sp.]|nr:hypothetical protein [Candidatus Azobacteroides sp.]
MEYRDEGIRNMNSAEWFTGHEFQTQHGLNTHDMGWRSLENSTGRIWTLDTKAEDYYWISPYVYCANNPIKWVDLDGQHLYYITSDGRIFILALDPESKEDTVYTNGENGNLESINISDQKLMLQLNSSHKNQTSAKTSNSNDAFNLFKFASDHTNVEWSLAGYKNESGKTNYVLNTSFSESYVTNVRLNEKREDMAFHVHSHPSGGDETKIASKYYDYVNYIDGDGALMAIYFNAAKAADKRFPDEYPKFFIYHKPLVRRSVPLRRG